MVIAVLIVVVRRVQVAVEMVVLVHVNPLVQEDVHLAAQALARVVVVLIVRARALELQPDNVWSAQNNVCNIVATDVKTHVLAIAILHVIGLVVGYAKLLVKRWDTDRTLVQFAQVHALEPAVQHVQVIAREHVI